MTIKVSRAFLCGTRSTKMLCIVLHGSSAVTSTSLKIDMDDICGMDGPGGLRGERRGQLCLFIVDELYLTLCSAILHNIIIQICCGVCVCVCVCLYVCVLVCVCSVVRARPRVCVVYCFYVSTLHVSVGSVWY